MPEGRSPGGGGGLWGGYSDVVKSKTTEIEDTPAADPAWVKATVFTVIGIAGFLFAANTWEAVWWNFIGATMLGAGGVFGTMSTYGVVQHETRPASWTMILIGGAVVAGAALPGALAAPLP